MNFKKLLLIVLAAAIAFGVLSCKKEEETTTYSSSFRSTPSFQLPDFVQVNERYLLVPAEVERELGDTCKLAPGILWAATFTSTTRDTLRWEGEDPKLNDGSYILVIPDTLITITLRCSAFAKGYYDSYYDSYCTVVDQERSLTGQGLDPALKFPDERDEQEYCYTVIGNLDFMSQNVAYKGNGETEIGYSYYNSPIMDKIFGRMYTLDEAASACPPGWRLPKQEDFNTIARVFNPSASYSATETMKNLAGHLMTDAYFNRTKMWEYWPKVNIDNATGFSAMPVGYATIDAEGNCQFKDTQLRSMWWTGDMFNSNQGILKYIYADSPDVFCFAGHRDYLAAPVRCVREHVE